MSVTHVARSHDVTRQQVYRWRHEFKKRGLWPTGAGAVEGALFLPIDFQVAEMAAPEPAPPSPVELRLPNGRWLRFDTGVDKVALTQLIQGLGFGFIWPMG